jgi:hypothetical protein
MRNPVAVLCPGPRSLSKVWCDDLFDCYALVVAVNTAGWLFRCHWLAGVDDHVIRPVMGGTKRRPLRGILSNTGWRTEIVHRRFGWECLGRFYEMGENERWAAVVEKDDGKKVGVFRFTFPNALAWALAHSPASVDVFGVDWSFDRLDAAGDDRGDHKELRWMQEAEELRRLIRDLAPHQRDGLRIHGEAPAAVRDYIMGRRDTWEHVNPVAAAEREQRARGRLRLRLPV